MSEFSDYVLFGLRLRSAVPLPELPTSNPDVEPDLVIDYGEVRGDGTGGEPQAIPGGAMLVVDGIARYAILGGERIVVEPALGAAERNVRLYLLGSAMGMLLHQRGLLPLHANAVEIDGKAVAFMGASGAGKSTLAAWFQNRGYRIIADDVCVVTFSAGGRPLATPGLPRLRLWRAALEELGKDESTFQRSYAGDDEYDKFDVPISADGAVDRALPLAAVYLLGAGDDFSVTALAGLAAAEAVFANTYRGGFLKIAGDPRDHWHACLRLITETPVFQVKRRWSLTAMNESNRAILDHVRSLLSVSNQTPMTSG